MYEDPNKRKQADLPHVMTHRWPAHKMRALRKSKGKDNGKAPTAHNGRCWFNGYTHEFIPCPDGCRHGWTEWPTKVDLSDGVYCDTCDGNGVVNPNKFYADSTK